MNGRALVALLVLALPVPAAAVDATTPGAASSPYPTLRHLSLEWEISGDDDLDGVVSVRYRKQGAASWLQGLPLRRVPAGSNEGFSWGNKHAGSVFDLEPGQAYEVELTLVDPDGGSASTTLVAATRPVPRAAPGAPERAATSASFAAVAAEAVAGDVLLLAAGSYAGFTFAADGTPSAPIVIRAAVPGAVIVDGDVRLDGRRFVFLEGLVVHGMIKFNNAEGIVVRGCTVLTNQDGIVSMADGVSNATITDNVVLGPTAWADATVGANGDNLGEGIVLTGPGNVITHNAVKGFRDAISLMEDSGAHEQRSIDITNNDIEVGADDGIEADFAMGNCRILRNRISNSFVGLSAQPSLGGPTYFIRNVMFNVIYAPFKLHRGSVGDVALHNTSVKCGDAFAVYASVPWSRAYFRNNLFVGGTGGGTYGGYGNGSGRVAELTAADATCSFDYDGYGSIGTGTFAGQIGAASFASLAELRANTSEVHAVAVDLSVFAGSVELPSPPFPERAHPDLRPSATGGAIDAGVGLANVNNGYAGIAPDLGAYELGAAAPRYGPRPGEHPDYPLAGDDGAPADGGSGGDGLAADGAPAADAGAGGDPGGPAAGGAVSGGCACGGAAGGPLVIFGWRRRRQIAMLRGTRG